MYSNPCCGCLFEPEIIKIGQSSHKMYNNNIVNFQESTTILNSHTKKVWKLIVSTSYIYIYREEGANGLTVMGNGNGDSVSNPERSCLPFYIALILLGKLCIQLWLNSRADRTFFYQSMRTELERKLNQNL